jgi:hypothetical protein
VPAPEQPCESSPRCVPRPDVPLFARLRLVSVPVGNIDDATGRAIATPVVRRPRISPPERNPPWPHRRCRWRCALTREPAAALTSSAALCPELSRPCRRPSTLPCRRPSPCQSIGTVRFARAARRNPGARVWVARPGAAPARSEPEDLQSAPEHDAARDGISPPPVANADALRPPGAADGPERAAIRGGPPGVSTVCVARLTAPVDRPTVRLRATRGCGPGSSAACRRLDYAPMAPAARPPGRPAARPPEGVSTDTVDPLRCPLPAPTGGRSCELPLRGRARGQRRSDSSSGRGHLTVRRFL